MSHEGRTATAGPLRVSAEAHLEVTRRVLEGLGAPPAAANAQARLLLEGDLRGHASHGLRRLEVLVGRINSGALRPAAEPVLTWRTRAALAVDGGHGLGPPAAMRAAEELLGRVGETGVAVAAIRNANHLGMLAPYVELIAAGGAIGIAMTTSEALVHPWGGRHAMVGTNPLAVAVPTGAEPVVLDMATGQISMGKVLDHATRGLPLPDGAAVDADGNPTTDAEAATRGAISPFGGAKGYALAVVLETTVATLTGTALGRDVRGTLDQDEVCNKGDVLIAVAPPAFGADHASALRQYLTELRAADPAPGHDAVLVPGDRARATRERHLADGIPMAEATWQRAEQLVREVTARSGPTAGQSTT